MVDPVRSTQRSTLQIVLQCGGGLLFMIMLMLTACSFFYKTEKWIIPKGYVGWLRLDYGVAGAPPLPIENGRFLVRMPPTGRLQTSSLTNQSFEKNEYFYPDGGALDRLALAWPPIPGYAVQSVYRERHFRPNMPKWFTPEFECVFVGTRSDFNQKGDCSEWKVGEPKPPPFKKVPKK